MFTTTLLALATHTFFVIEPTPDLHVNDIRFQRKITVTLGSQKDGRRSSYQIPALPVLFMDTSGNQCFQVKEQSSPNYLIGEDHLSALQSLQLLDETGDGSLTTNDQIANEIEFVTPSGIDECMAAPLYSFDDERFIIELDKYEPILKMIDGFIVEGRYPIQFGATRGVYLYSIQALPVD